MNLPALIRERLQQCEAIPFVEFMQLALYQPQFGYYSSRLEKFGKNGDFVTAPELTPLFGQTLANQCQQILAAIDVPVIVEYGAGSGRLCIDLLQQLEKLNSLPQCYYIMEVSAYLRQRQKTCIEQEIPHLASSVKWLETWPSQPLSGIILANEVIDAMPVHRFAKKGESILESFITLDAEGNFKEIFKPDVDQRLTDYLIAAFPKPTGDYQSEANLYIPGWLQGNSMILEQGAMLIIDYGFPRHEYYHPDRNQGTLMCHYRHQAHSNPLIHVGEQDITAHVDFTHIAEAADAAGFAVAGYTNQASFLLANGILELLPQNGELKDSIAMKQALKCLLEPQEMGELFKVMALTKNLNLELTGFKLNDKRASL